MPALWLNAALHNRLTAALHYCSHVYADLLRQVSNEVGAKLSSTIRGSMSAL